MNLNTAGWASPLLRLLARLDSDGPNSTTPVTEINGGNISATNADIALVAKGTGATLAQVPDGTIAGGNKRGTYATDWQKNRTAATQIASAQHGTVAGGSENTAGTNEWATVGGGRNNTSSGSYATIAGGRTNTSSQGYATIAGGNLNVASGLYSSITGGSSNTASSSSSFVGGGESNTANGTSSTVCGGSTNTTSAANSTVCGGQNNTANGIHSFIGGGRRGTARSIAGCHVFPACDVPISDSNGVTQSALVLLARQTTDATATVLASNTSAASTNNQVTLPNNSAYSFSGEVIAGVTGAGNSARWTIDGAIKRGANAASTVMIGTPTVTMTHFDVGAAAWVVAVTADTTNGAIAVTVTGAASTTIRWTCKINTTEMTF